MDFFLSQLIATSLVETIISSNHLTGLFFYLNLSHTVAKVIFLKQRYDQVTYLLKTFGSSH